MWLLILLYLAGLTFPINNTVMLDQMTAKQPSSPRFYTVISALIKSSEALLMECKK